MLNCLDAPVSELKFAHSCDYCRDKFLQFKMFLMS